ncbi:MAG: hypothetical protein E7302_10915 [Butyrivibrio sp.]|nr:hypothetical protein [Butyrivibrio sp.]
MNKNKAIVLSIVKIIIAALLIECFIFNFRALESIGYKEIADFNSIEYTGFTEDSGKYSPIPDVEQAIEIKDIDAEIKNVYLDIKYKKTKAKDYFPVVLNVTDEANSQYLTLNSTEIVPTVPESKYLRTHLIGKSKNLKINLSNLNSEKEYEITVSLNKRRPFCFQLWRIALIAFIILLVKLFGYKSALYRIKLDLADKKQKAFVIVFFLLTVTVFLTIASVFTPKKWKTEEWQANLQYNYVAQAMLNGHVWLDKEVPASLNEMDNPYDFAERTRILEENGESVVMDLAYFDGKYYSYFGVMPVIVFYLPYMLLTGDYLNTLYPILICVVIFLFAAYWFMHTMAKRHYPSTSLGAYILLTSTFIFGSEALYFVQKTTIYSLPIAMGTSLGLLGVSFWLNAITERGELRKGMLIAGAISIAMIMGCRPHLAIVLLFIFPIFGRKIIFTKFFSKKGIPNSACVIVPFLIVGIGVMAYNYARFGSVFDFGATYNLTGFDMTHRGFIPERFFLGYWEYLFQPFSVSARFPYIDVVAGHMGLAADYQGQIINEPLLGGFFAFNLIGIYMLKLKACMGELKKKGILPFILTSMAFAAIIVSVDIQMVGMTIRYLSDFSMFFMIATVLIILTDLERRQPENGITRIVICLCALCIFVNLFTLMANGRYTPLFNADRHLYFKIKYQLMGFLSIR